MKLTVEHTHKVDPETTEDLDERIQRREEALNKLFDDAKVEFESALENMTKNWKQTVYIGVGTGLGVGFVVGFVVAKVTKETDHGRQS